MRTRAGHWSACTGHRCKVANQKQSPLGLMPKSVCESKRRESLFSFLALRSRSLFAHSTVASGQQLLLCLMLINPRPSSSGVVFHFLPHTANAKDASSKTKGRLMLTGQLKGEEPPGNSLHRDLRAARWF